MSRNQSTRRKALVTLAAGAALPLASGQAQLSPAAQRDAYEPRSLTPDQFRLTTDLVDLILPPSETPGAAAAGADRYIDEELAQNAALRELFQQGLQTLSEAGFETLPDQERVALLSEYSLATDLRGRFFKLLKDLTIDGYYSSEIGLVHELGYQGNGYLKDFPGCQDEEHL